MPPYYYAIITPCYAYFAADIDASLITHTLIYMRLSLLMMLPLFRYTCATIIIGRAYDADVSLMLFADVFAAIISY